MFDLPPLPPPDLNALGALVMNLPAPPAAPQVTTCVVEVVPGVRVSLPCTAPHAPAPRATRPGSRPVRHDVPAFIDMRTPYWAGPVKDQGQVGVCWAFAMSSAMENALRRERMGDVVSPMHLVAKFSADNVMWKNNELAAPVTVESVMPYDPVKACQLNESRSEVWCERAYGVRRGSWRHNPSLAFEVARADASARFRFAREDGFSSPLRGGELATALAGGQVIAVSMEISRSAWSIHGRDTLPEWNQADAAHGVTLVGYRWNGGIRQFLIQNSWGQRWGSYGYAWISEAMLERYASYAYTVRVSGR